MSKVFTPMTADRSTKLEFPIEDIEVVSGSPFETGRGHKGVIRVDGKTYEVKGAPCGLRCYCAATVTEIPG